MEKRFFIFVVLCFAIVTSCDLLGLGEEKGAPQIKDFTWNIDTLEFPNTMIDLSISGESINDIWIANRFFDSGVAKYLGNELFVSSKIQFISNVKHFKGNFYGGGLGDLKKLAFTNKFELKSMEAILSIERFENDFQFGVIVDMEVIDNNVLYLLCNYHNKDLMPSFTTIIKWDGIKSNQVYISESAVQGQHLISGSNGIFYKGFKFDLSGTLVKKTYGIVGSVQNDNTTFIQIADNESDYLSLGKISDLVFLKYNEDLFALNDGNMIPTGIRFPENTFGFTGYSESNIWISSIIWGALDLSEEFFKPEQEEIHILDPALIGSESFDFCIEGFGACVG